MENTLNIITKFSKSDCVHGRILESYLDLEVFKMYFQDAGAYKITMGCRGIEHTTELFKAYKRTAEFWKNNQKELLDCILDIVTQQYKAMWEEEKKYFINSSAESDYNEAKKHYNQLMNKKQLKQYIKISRIHFIPIKYDKICYAALCFIDISDFEIYHVSPIWIILEENRLIGTDCGSEEDEDELYYINYVKSFKQTGRPFLFWEEIKMLECEQIEVPHHLGKGSNLTKFKKLLPYLSNMRLEAVTKSAKQDYFLPRGAYPIGEYNGMVYFFLKEKNKKWEDCPVFDLDSSLELQGCIPLAENLLSFLKLATITNSFFSISTIARFSMKEYQRYKTRNHNKYDVGEEINVIEKNFHLPEINDVFVYLNNLKKNKDYVKMGQDIIYNMYKKRSMEEEYDDIYEKK